MYILETKAFSPQFNARQNFVKIQYSQIETMISQGLSVAEISQKTKTHPTSIYKFLRLIGINPPCKQKKINQTNIDNILLANIKLFIDKNLTIEDIAKKTGCKIKEINNWLNKNGHKIKKLMRVEMFKSGMSARQVAEECKISIERAFQLKRDFIHENLLQEESQMKRGVQIQNDLRSGMKTKEVAKKYKLSPSAIYKYKKQGNISQETVSEVRKRQILAMIREGLGIREMARQLGVSSEVIKNEIKKHNLKPLMIESRDRIEDMILADAESGIYLEKLAEIYGYSKRTISNKIKRAKARNNKLSN